MVGLKRHLVALRRSLVSTSMASLLAMAISVAAYGVAISFAQYRELALGVAVSLTFTLVAAITKRHYDNRNQPYLLRSEYHLIKLRDQGKRVIFENRFKVRSRRRDGLERYRMRLRWSGEDELGLSVESMFDDNVQVTVSLELDSLLTPTGYRFIDFEFGDKLGWRRSIDLGVRFELFEPARMYTPVMGFTAHRYPMSMFARLRFGVEWDASVPLDVLRTRVLEYADPSDHEFQRSLPRNTWNISRLKRRGMERRISWQIWPVPPSGYFRFEYGFKDGS